MVVEAGHLRASGKSCCHRSNRRIGCMPKIKVEVGSDCTAISITVKQMTLHVLTVQGISND